MGTPVIYCAKCGEMIPPKDIVPGKAVNLAGVNYCANCNPLNPVQIPKSPPSAALRQPPPTVKGPTVKPASSISSRSEAYTTGRTRFAQKPVSVPGKRARYPARTTKRKIPTAYLIAGGVGVVVLVLVLLLYSARQTKQQTQAHLAQAQQAFDKIIQYEKAHPLDFKTTLGRLTNQRYLVEQTPVESQWNGKLSEIKTKLDIWEKVDQVKQKSDETPQDYDGVLEQYSELKKQAQEVNNNQAITDEIGQQIDKVVLRRDKEASNLYEKLKTEVDVHLLRKAFSEALRLCEEFPTYLKNSQAQAKVNKLKETIKQEEKKHLEQLAQGQELFNGRDTTGWRLQGPPGSAPCKATVENSILTLENTYPEAPSFAFVGEPDWKDYTVEISFKSVQGALTLLLRADYRNLNVQFIPIQPPRKFGTDWQKLVIELKGEQYSLSGPDINPPQVISIPKSASPRGAIGFMLPPSAKIIIQELRAKSIK